MTILYRGFLIVLALISVYLIYDTARLVLLKGAIHSVDDSYVLGPDQNEAELTIVEFLDYSCPRCQNTHPVLMAALQDEKSVRYIPRPLSTDNENGRRAAHLAYAAGRQGKFFEAHEALINDFRAVNEAYINTLANRLDLDAERLKRDMNDPEILEQVADNEKYNAKIGSHTIPTLFINNHLLWVVMGDAPDIQTMENVIAEAKASR